MRPAPGSLLRGAVVAAVAAAVVAGLLVLGSPMEERARRVDARRVADLQAIKAAADLYWTRHSTLPASLRDLGAEPGVRIRTVDPEGSAAYEYEVLEGAGYELCATFEQESGAMTRDPSGALWAHGSGRQCFRLEAERIDEREG